GPWYAVHLLDRRDGRRHQSLGVDAYAIPRAPRDRLPQLAKALVHEDRLVDFDHDASAGVADDRPGIALQHGQRAGGAVFEPRRQRQYEVVVLRLEALRQLAAVVEQADCLQVLPQLDGAGRAEQPARRARQLGERRTRHHAPRLAGLALVVGLQPSGEGVVGLVGDDRQARDLGVVDASAVLVDRQPKPAADLLPARDRGARVRERADLEDVGVVPALAQGGVGEEEAQRLVERQQLLLAAHDLLVRGAVA